MNEISPDVSAATTVMAHRNEKVRGQQMQKLIDGAAGAQQLSSSPPAEPVSLPPRAGSSVEVVA